MINEKILNNNLIFLGKKLDVRSVSFGFWIKTGVITENAIDNGITHFLEHMLFKGTELHDSKKIAYISDLLGGNINAYTTKEMVCLYGKVLDEDFKKALELLCDMLNKPKLCDEDIQKEKKVIWDEIAMYNDSPEELGYDELCKVLFPNQNYGMPILGDKDNVNGFTKERLENYYKKYFSTGNIVFSIAGNFDEKMTVQFLENAFTENVSVMENQNCDNHIKLSGGYSYTEKDLEQIHVHIGFKGLKFNHRDSYCLLALSNILGGSTSSRLFQRIREEHGLAYSIDTQPVFYKEAGFFNLYFSSSSGEIENAIEHIIYELKNIKNFEISSDEFEIAISSLKINYLMGLESSEEYMNFMAKSYYYLDRIIDIDEIVKNIELITIERIKTLANQILNSNTFAISIVGQFSDEKTKYIYDKICKELDD